MNLIRWVLWVDVEGFSYLYREKDSFIEIQLKELQSDLFKIGNDIFPQYSERLFIHQVGDGFVIKPTIGEENLDRPISITIALLRMTLMRGACLKIALGEGSISDVTGLWQKEIQDKYENNMVRIGEGIMTLFPIMGDGLIDAYNYSKCASGPLLIVRDDLRDCLPKDGLNFIEYNKHIEIDWIHSRADFAQDILTAMGAKADVKELCLKLEQYIKKAKSLPDNWRKAAFLLIRGYLNVENIP